MTLRDLLQGLTNDPVAAIPVAGISRHSKQVRSGDLFVALEGATTDGHAFIAEAVARGAAAVVAKRLPALHRSRVGLGDLSRPCPCVVVRDTREALAMIAQRFYGHPSRKLKLVGVTGTNGKTTTTYLVKAILEASGGRAGLLGTIVYQIGERAVPSTNTTPGPLELQRYFAQMVGEALDWCAMEVSSHALAQDRVAGLEFQAAIFTNLGSDHLDYHKTREAYAAAKRRLFDHLRSDGTAVINVDDEHGRALAQTLPQHRVVTYGIEQAAEIFAADITCTWQGTRFTLQTPSGPLPIDTPLLGRHNVSNLTAAAAALLALGVPPAAVQRGAAMIPAVPGRLERVPGEDGVRVIIDYAHTADALRLALRSLRELTRGRLILVFGCGGDRDATKRPVMGQVASQLADQVILTSDNPRGEDPMAIIRQIQGGFAEGLPEAQVLADREQAITAALGAARPDDTVLIAGKGHETYQIFNDVFVPFSDREIVERWTASRHSVAVS